MGTQGYINYNPTLLLRQLGYPMQYPPSEESMTPLIVHGMGPHHTGILRNIRTAWGSSSSMGDATQEPGLTKGKEIVKARNKKEDLKRELEAAYKGQKRAWEEVDKERKIDEQMDKRASIEEEIRLRAKECLKAVDLVMCLRRAERDQALLEKQELIEMLMEAKREERERLGRMELLEQQIGHLNTELLREQFDKANLEFLKEHIQAELWASQERSQLLENKAKESILTVQAKILMCKEQLSVLADQAQQQLVATKSDSNFWEDRYRKVVWLANQALIGILEALRKVEWMVDP
ncbi:hypothetical protein CR513_13429, partial [Mucuna pruriens]